MHRNNGDDLLVVCHADCWRVLRPLLTVHESRLRMAIQRMRLFHDSMRIAVAMSGLLLALLLLHDYAVAGDVFEAAVVGHRAAVEGLASYTCHIEVTRYKLPAGPERRFVGKYWRWGGRSSVARRRALEAAFRIPKRPRCVTVTLRELCLGMRESPAPSSSMHESFSLQ